MSIPWCVQRTSNLEGWRHIHADELPLTEIPTTDSIDLRVRRLEALYSIDSPAPMTSATWRSLEYRILRLDRTWTPARNLLKDHPLTCPDDELEVMATMRAILSKFDLVFFEDDLIALNDTADEKEVIDPAAQLVALSQCLSYVAGRHHIRSPDAQKTLAEVYAFAIELSIAVPNPIKTIPQRVAPLPSTLRHRVPVQVPFPSNTGGPVSAVRSNPTAFVPAVVVPSQHVGPTPSRGQLVWLRRSDIQGVNEWYTSMQRERQVEHLKKELGINKTKASAGNWFLGWLLWFVPRNTAIDEEALVDTAAVDITSASSRTAVDDSMGF